MQCFIFTKNPELLLEPLWNNKLFQIVSKPVYKEKWYQQGIHRVSDLFNNNGSIHTFIVLKKKPFH